MARITHFKSLERERKLVAQPTEVVGHFKTEEVDGKKLFQLDTYGSNQRAQPGKQSQTIQLDKKAAAQFVDILRREFNL